MAHRVTMALAAALFFSAAAGHAALMPYSQNFEGLLAPDPAALGNDSWLVYGNVFSPDHSIYYYGYGPYPAPNTGVAFSAIAIGQGGDAQGFQQLSVYSDYENGDHANHNLVESNIYREWWVSAPDVGNTWTFQFDAKLGNLVAPSTAVAFIKTLNPSAGWALTNFITADMTSIPATWNTYWLQIPIDASLVGQVLQIGFANTTTDYIASGVFYDNVVWTSDPLGVPGRVSALDLRPASPNPFTSSTRVDFSLAQAGAAEVSVYDVTGRLVATLVRGQAEPGPHFVVWNGRTADGGLAPAGVYQCVLRTDAGRKARSIVLSR